MSAPTDPFFNAAHYAQLLSAEAGSALSLRRDFAINPSMSASALGTAINSAIQSAISAGRALSLGYEEWPIDVPLLINGPLHLRSEGVLPMFGSRNVGGGESLNEPFTSPYLKGGVIKQTSAGADVLQLTGAGVAVNLTDIGIRFDDAIDFTNTGNGITAKGPVLSTAFDNGLEGAHWRNVLIAGHDGNHYAVDLTNPILCTFDHLQSYGGGGLRVSNDAPGGSGWNYGNLVFNHPYFDVVAAGSAHGIRLSSPALNTGGAANGSLQIMVFTRPQVWLRNSGVAAFNGPPTNAQKLISKDSGVKSITLIQPDLESNVATPVFDSDAQMFLVGGYYISPSILPVGGNIFQGQSVGSNGPYNGLQFFQSSTIQYIRQLASGASGDIQFGLGATDNSVYLPSFLACNGNGRGIGALTAAAGAGTGAPTPTSSSDGAAGTAQPLKGVIKWGTGTGPAAGDQVNVTHGQAAAFRGPVPSLTPLNAATAALGLYASNIAAGSYRIACANAPAASQAVGTYQVGYHCIA